MSLGEGPMSLDGDGVPPAKSSGGDSLRSEIAAKKQAAGDASELSEAELDLALSSLQQAGSAAHDELDWAALRALLARSAHLPHKDWARTEAAAAELEALLSNPADATFRDLFHRVLTDGNWPVAAQAAASRTAKPWVVLVTGVNGIRKTSAVYQPWFKTALSQALAEGGEGGEGGIPTEDLPDGNDSYFRQLDYMIATVANLEFKRLYKDFDDVEMYAAYKDAIFARWRTYAEMLGVLLLKAGKRQRMNVMVETSGRDIAMFKYIDHFFPGEEYNKLVVHCTINDIKFAETSVDGRMLGEMRQGRAALAGSTRDVIAANAGGPYGSAVLKGVQADSDAVWESVRRGTAEGGAGRSWSKARLAITAHESEPWTARAVPADGRPTEAFAYGPPRKTGK